MKHNKTKMGWDDTYKGVAIICSALYGLFQLLR